MHQMTGEKHKVATSERRSVFVDLEGHDRLRGHSPMNVNDRIATDIENSVRRLSGADPDEITRRIDELDGEWDLERSLMIFFSVVGGITWTVGMTRNRKWLYLLPVQIGFLTYQAMVGWCPPMALLRRLGFRSSREIDAEKYALKTLRGDYKRESA